MIFRGGSTDALVPEGDEGYQHHDRKDPAETNPDHD
jgi:hypothetical protein